MKSLETSNNSDGEGVLTFDKPLLEPRQFHGAGHGGTTEIPPEVLFQQVSTDMLFEGYEPFHLDSKSLMQDLQNAGLAAPSQSDPFKDLSVPCVKPKA